MDPFQVQPNQKTGKELAKGTGCPAGKKGGETVNCDRANLQKGALFLSP